MSVFRYRADRPRVALFAAIFVLDVAVYLTVDNPIALGAYFVLGIFPKGCICAFNHHHQHVETFRVSWLNRLLEIMYALQTGVTSHTWVLHHSVGHHLDYLDQTRDQSRWRRKSSAVMGKLEYTLHNGVLAYPRAWRVGARHKSYRRIFLVMGTLTLLIVGALVWNRPLPGLIVFVAAPAFALFGTVYATYLHHSNRSTESGFEACTNVLQPLYNLCTGNLGYHTAHHFRAGVHWSKLPELHAKILDRVPADSYLAAGFPWKLVDRRVHRPSPVATRNSVPTVA
jgi:fatty acid desaturase